MSEKTRRNVSKHNFPVVRNGDQVTMTKVQTVSTKQQEVLRNERAQRRRWDRANRLAVRARRNDCPMLFAAHLRQQQIVCTSPAGVRYTQADVRSFFPDA